MSYTEEMLCSKTHEYIVKEDDNGVIGLTEYAVEQLGDIVFLELPEVNNTFAKGECFANIESVKAASEIYMPVAGEIVEVNDSLVDSPELLNQDCYENGWLVKIKPESYEDDVKDLMTYSEYKQELE